MREGFKLQELNENDCTSESALGARTWRQLQADEGTATSNNFFWPAMSEKS